MDGPDGPKVLWRQRVEYEGCPFTMVSVSPLTSLNYAHYNVMSKNCDCEVILAWKAPGPPFALDKVEKLLPGIVRSHL